MYYAQQHGINLQGNKSSSCSGSNIIEGAIFTAASANILELAMNMKNICWIQSISVITLEIEVVIVTSEPAASPSVVLVRTFRWWCVWLRHFKWRGNLESRHFYKNRFSGRLLRRFSRNNRERDVLCRASGILRIFMSSVSSLWVATSMRQEDQMSCISPLGPSKLI